MEMYQVDFQAHFQNVADIGTMLVCASGQDAAGDVVLAWLDLPRSKTILKVTRVKPSIYQLQRRSVSKYTENASVRVTHREPPPPLNKFNISISAVVTGHSEQHALRKVGGSVLARVGAPHSKPPVALAIECNLVEPQRKLKVLEQVELYKARI
jgi:hypothetical protein